MSATPPTEEAHGAVPTMAELRRHFADGEKPAGTHRLGVEHEKVAVLARGMAPTYEDHIRPLLEALSARAGWEPQREDEQGHHRGTADGQHLTPRDVEPGPPQRLGDLHDRDVGLRDRYPHPLPEPVGQVTHPATLGTPGGTRPAVTTSLGMT